MRAYGMGGGGRGRTRFPEYKSLVSRDPFRASIDRESKIQMERKRGAPEQDEMIPFDQLKENQDNTALSG